MTIRLFIALMLVFSIASGTVADATEIAEHEKAISPQSTLSDVQRKEVHQITKAYAEKTRPLREELWAKRTMLRALTNNPNAEVNDIQKIVNAMKELRAKLHAERVVFEEGMMKKYGFIPSNSWTDNNDAFRPADTASDSATEDSQKPDGSAPKPKGFFSRLFD
ncbi:Spy/CpxP family protein refolding chaperone [Halodesulfovibrio spirochaetisodalis]|uniref:Zinc resistance-associated protein n=1 Tax=Halodesulfovibrio spirochaetisodalis TaxID=1560234 RepID=A0A1B7XMS5_9BACT|nr:periplasmic heavy metal sensor [Halodesulfovibrio spirochaetisodalis]OBQ56813.1 hypothetical protein SP90_01705 [Halodesulfovibrio spirochaetisodalis]